jgi:hypothetical protein
MTGPAAIFGHGVFDGANLAIKEINDRRGILGKKVSLVASDDQCNPTLAAPSDRANGDRRQSRTRLRKMGFAFKNGMKHEYPLQDLPPGH